MSVKIKVSYTDDRELTEVVKRLHPVRDVRKQPAKGRYKRAYVSLESAGKTRNNGNELENNW